MQITKKTNLQKLLKKYPEAAEILVEGYNLHSAGCMVAAFFLEKKLL